MVGIVHSAFPKGFKIVFRRIRVKIVPIRVKTGKPLKDVLGSDKF